MNGRDVSVILLAGGKGTRMKTDIPKQFLQLREKPLARYSFDLFLTLNEVAEIIVVCDSAYHEVFFTEDTPIKIHFAEPGTHRQDSVYNGLQKVHAQSNLVCVHDSARPFVDAEMTRRALLAARKHGAATIGMPVKFTVKECDKNRMVTKTPPRDFVWEIQTPQVIQSALFKKGFQYIRENHIAVTDDASVVESIGLPVKLVEGSYRNLKITTYEDFLLAENIVKECLSHARK
jgi:2-C-methyl-D-erythritol 4-phosphate cytidylyltransferase